MLIGSLPDAEAPAGMAEDVMAVLEGRTLLDEGPEHSEQRIGARHLLVRKVLATAAMIGLIAVLGAVIYSIVGSEIAPNGLIAIEEAHPSGAEYEIAKPEMVAVAADSEKPDTQAVVAVAGFSGRLELSTDEFAASDAFVKTVLESHGLAETAVVALSQEDKNLRSINCDLQTLNSILAELGKEWGRFDSAKLFVDVAQADTQIEVGKVTAEQIAEIAGHADIEKRVKAANYFAVLNDVTRRIPGQGDKARPDLVTIPKPILTSGQETAQTPAGEIKGEQKVQLTIVLVGSE